MEEEPKFKNFFIRISKVCNTQGKIEIELEEFQKVPTLSKR